MRIRGTIMKDNRWQKEETVSIEDMNLSRTRKVYQALNEICYLLDLAVPIWLDSNKKEFIRHARTKFRKDNFIEQISFDYLDFQVVEEDW